MGKSLAEACGANFKDRIRPRTAGSDPQLGEQWTKSTPSLWIAGMARATPRKSAGPGESSCWQNLWEANKPRFAAAY